MTIEGLQQGFRNYAIQKIGEERGRKIKKYGISTIVKSTHAAFTLVSKYDIGIGIASDGLQFSYLFGLYGLQTIVVDMKRTLNGVTWKEIDPISEKQIKNKKVIFFDNDIVTGRTIRRAVKEINKFHPQKMDLLLSMYNTYMSKTNHKRYKKSLRKELNKIGKEKWGRATYYILDPTHNIPKEIGKVFALDKDFKNIHHTDNLEEKLLDLLHP